MVTVTTQLPDAQQPMLDTTAEDQLGVEIDDVTNNGDVRVQIRETGQMAWDGAAVGYHETVLASDSDTSGTLTTTFTALEDGEEYEARVRTETEHATGAWTTPVSGTLPFPAPTNFQITSRFDTVEATFTDNSDHADEVIKLQRSLDGGSTWTTVATYTANTTDVDDSSPIFYEVVDYRIRQESEHTFALSNVATDVVARSDDTFWAEIHKPNAPGSTPVLQAAVGPSRIQGVDQLDLEHTAISGWQLTIAPAFDELRDYHLGDVTIYSGDEKIIRGPLQRTPKSGGTITLAGEGPGHALRQDTTRQSYSRLPVHEAIEDYVSNTPADTWTVIPPSVTDIEVDRTLIDTTVAGQFDAIFGPFDPDEPVAYDAANNTLELAQTGWFQEAEDATIFGSPTVTGDNSRPFTMSDGEGLQFDSAGDEFQFDFTPAHDIPADDVTWGVRYWQSSTFQGDIVIYIDGEESFRRHASGDRSMGWLDSVATTEVSDDLKAGTTYTFRVVGDDQYGDELDTNPWEGALVFDCAWVGDSGDRFGGWNYTFDNDGTGETLSGPGEYPDQYTIRAQDAQEVFHIREMTVSVTMDDVGGDQAIRLSTVPETDDFVETQNAASLTAEFDAADMYGFKPTLEIDLSSYSSGDGASPTSRDATQTLSDLQWTVTTDDLPIIGGAGLELNGESWMQNLKTLHDAGGFRYTIDHREPGLVAESYRRGDPAAVKSADWTTNGEDAVTSERDTSEYFNEVRVLPAPDSGLSDIVVRHPNESERVDRIERRAIDSGATTVDERLEAARKALRDGIAGDRISGTVQIHPTYIPPGYQYEPAEFDGERSNLERVSLSKGSGGASGSLQFGSRKDLVAAIRRGSN